MTVQDPSSPNSVALVLREVSTADADAKVSGRDPGSRIGRYVLEGPLEDAGVGALYAAHDSKLERRVALRLIPSSHEDGTPYSRARLLRETRSMARLSHPNVIQIYDVGATRRELFIAMELLDGESVKNWIHRASRPWSDVLSTFVDAGRGLVAAHDAGFVHGDFDSRSIRRTKDGRVVVTDFGLTRARTRDDGLTNPGTDTRLVRDDQYAFCAALYEALFHEDTPASVGELEQRPAVQDSGVPKRVLRALARGLSREHRYASMKALLRALEPRGGRRLLALAAATTVFVGGAGIAYAIAGIGSENHCSASALPPELDSSHRALALEVLRDASPGHGADSAAWVERHLDAWTASWTDAWSAQCHAGAPEPTPCLQQAAGQTRALVVALSNGAEGTTQQAEMAILELPSPARCESLGDGAIERPSEFSDAWNRAWARVALGDLQTAIAQLQVLVRDTEPGSALRLKTVALLGRAQADAGSPQAASRSLREVLDAPSTTSAERREVTVVLARVLLEDLDRPAQAKALLDAVRSEVEASTGSPRLRSALFELDAQLARSNDDLDAARSLYAKAETALADHGDAERLHATSVALRRGAFEVSAGDYGEAMRHFRRAQHERTEMLGLSHPWVAEALTEVAGAWIGQGELVAARDTLETAVEIYESTYPPEHPTMLATRGRLALLLGLTGRLDTSLEMFEDVIARESKRIGENSDPVAKYLTNRAVLLLRADRVDDAKADLDRALSIRRVLDDSEAQATVLNELANVAMKREDPVTAERLTREALGLQVQDLGEDHPMLSPSLVVLGDALSQQPGREAEARATYERALSIVEAKQGKDHFNVAFSVTGLGRLDARAGEHDAARARLTRAIALLEQADYGSELEMTARIELADLEWNSGHKDLAIELARAAFVAAKTREPSAVPAIETWLSAHGDRSETAPDGVH